MCGWRVILFLERSGLTVVLFSWLVACADCALVSCLCWRSGRLRVLCTKTRNRLCECIVAAPDRWRQFHLIALLFLHINGLRLFFFFFFLAINKSIDLWLIGYPLLGLLRKLESGRFDLLLLLREKADRVTEKKPRAIALTSFGQWQGHHRTIAVAWFIKGLPVIGQGPGERHKTVQQVVNVGGGVVVDGKVVDEQVRPLHAGERETSNNYFLPNICRFF